MESLRTILEQEYGFVVLEQREAGASTVVSTNEGDFYLYSVGEGHKNKKKWIDRVTKQIEKQTGLNVLPIARTQSGKQFVEGTEEVYYLQPAVGVTLPSDQAYNLGRSLAMFHKSTASSPADSSLASYRSLGSWPTTWRKTLQQFERYRDGVEAEMTELMPLDVCLVMNYTYINQIADTAIQYLVDNGYQKVLKETAKLSKVSYQNFDDGFIVFDQEGTGHLGGVYNWVIDMRARDIGQWLKAQIRRNGWDEHTVQTFLSGYHSKFPLLEEEFAVIYALMMYPSRVLRFVSWYDRLAPHQRQEQQQFWVKQLEEDLIQMEQALRNYPELILQQYGVAIPEVDWLSAPCPEVENGLGGSSA